MRYGETLVFIRAFKVGPDVENLTSSDSSTNGTDDGSHLLYGL